MISRTRAIATMPLLTVLCLISTPFPSPGRLIITSDPPDGLLFLDTRKIGTVPQTVEGLAPGVHDVRVYKEGYANWYQRMHIEAAKEYRITARLVKKAKQNHVEIRSNPTGAEVYLDEEYRGETPITIYFIPAGNHEVTLYHNSLSSSEAFTLRSRETKSIEAELIEQQSIVTVRSPLDSLYVEVDGEWMGQAPCDFSVPPGKRAFRFYQDENHESVMERHVTPGKGIQFDVHEVVDNSEYEKKLASFSKRSKWHRNIGFVSTGASVTFLLLMNGAYNNYLDSRSWPDMENQINRAETYRILAFSLAGASLYSFFRYLRDREPTRDELQWIEVRHE